MQALPAPGESLCIIEMGGTSGTEPGEQATTGGLFLSIGLAVSVKDFFFLLVQHIPSLNCSRNYIEKPKSNRFETILLTLNVFFIPNVCFI